MLKRCLFLPGLVVTVAAFAQAPASQVDLANLQEDIRGLTQRVNDLSLDVEHLEHERSQSADPTAAAAKDYATVAQLNQAVAELNRAIQSAVADSRNETLQRVGDQMEKLARQTNAALDALARTAPGRPAGQGVSTGPGPERTYTVEGGDTLASISKKTGARVSDIIDANRISDPSRILVGQTLVIPLPGNK
jgi:LysM repeat protein